MAAAGGGEEAHGSLEAGAEPFPISPPPLRRASAHINANALKPRQRANGEENSERINDWEAAPKSLGRFIGAIIHALKLVAVERHRQRRHSGLGIASAEANG